MSFYFIFSLLNGLTVSYSFPDSEEQVSVTRVSSLSITTRTRRPGPFVFPPLTPRLTSGHPGREHTFNCLKQKKNFLNDKRARNPFSFLQNGDVDTVQVVYALEGEIERERRMGRNRPGN